MKLEAKHVDELKEFLAETFRREVVLEFHDHPDGEDAAHGSLVIIEFGISVHAKPEGFEVASLTGEDVAAEVIHSTWAAALFDIGKRLVEQLFSEIVDRKSDAAYAEDLRCERELLLHWKDEQALQVLQDILENELGEE